MKFDHITKLYMHKPESVLENEMHKLFWDFEIQTDYLIPTKTPDLVIAKKKKKNKWWKKNDEKKKEENLPNSELYRPGGPQSENQRKWKDTST